MHAGQVVSVRWCTRPYQPHGPHGSPTPVLPLRTHAAHSHAHSPFLWSPPPLQSLACLGWTSLRPLRARNSSVCGTQCVAINTINGPLQCVKSGADLLRHVQRSERRGFHLDLKVTSCLTSTTGRSREGLQRTQWRANVTKALFVPLVTDGGKNGMNSDACHFCFAYFY